MVALIDKSKKYVLIVFEKSYPVNLRKWGLTKGKVKEGETTLECGHREVCEEVGIEIAKYEHRYTKLGNNQIVIIEKDIKEIKMYLGKEILEAKWVLITWLKEDIEKSPEKYNSSARFMIDKIQNL